MQGFQNRTNHKKPQNDIPISPQRTVKNGQWVSPVNLSFETQSIASKTTRRLVDGYQKKFAISKSAACKRLGDGLEYSEKYVLQVYNETLVPNQKYEQRIARLVQPKDTRAGAIRMTNDHQLRKEFMREFLTIESRDEVMRKALDE